MTALLRSASLSLLLCLFGNEVAALPAVTGMSARRVVASPGEEVTLGVQASGSGSLSYAWTHNGRAVHGVTSSILVLDNAGYEDAGWYTVTVSDQTGSTRSSPIFVRVAPEITRPQGWNYSSIWVGQYGQDSIPDDLTDAVAIAASTYHSVALKRNGTVLTWTRDYYSQQSIQVPPDLTDVVAVAAGMRYSIALKSDGTLVDWGSGQPHAPAGLAGVVGIAASPVHALALKSDGTVVAWGNNHDGRCDVPVGLRDVVEIACNYYHSLALKSDGTVVGWGSNYFGQLDPPAGLTDAVAVAAGNGHSLALRKGGTVVAWGDNQLGQCDIPAELSDVVAIATANDHSLALKSDGTVVMWGAGQTSPPAGVSAVFAISAARVFSFALSDATTDTAPVITAAPADSIRAETQTVTFTVAATGPLPMTYQWRKNGVTISGATLSHLTIPNLAFADEGDYEVVVANYLGSTTSPPAHLTVNPAPVVTSKTLSRQVLRPGQTLRVSISATGTGGLVYEWIHNGRPIAGATTATFSREGVDYSDSGWYFAVVSDEHGSRRSEPFFVTVAPEWVQVVAWPIADHGPTKIPASLIDATALAVGGSHAVARRPDGSVVQWGDDSYGVRPPPARVTDIVAVAAGIAGALALKSDGTVIEWDSNSYEVAVPARVRDVVAIAQGYRYSLALRSDGSVVEWGILSPGVPAQLTNVVAIAAGSNHALALRADGTVSAWGQNHKGQATVPPGLSNVVAIAAGDQFSLALMADGAVVGWGDNTYGQSNRPAGLNGVVAISAGERHGMGLRGDGTVVAWGNGGAGPAAVPVGLRDVFAIAAGNGYSLALRDAVSDLLAITAQPLAVTSSESQTAEFAVAVAGGGVLSYQWRKNGVDLPGATTSRLTLTDLRKTDAGEYSVVVSNYLGFLTSGSATLTVNPSPAITWLSPRRYVLSAGEHLNLAVEAVGTGALSYQWTRNGRLVPGSTSQTLTVPIQSTLDGGYYHVYVSDSLGTRRSPPIFVIVTSAPSVTRVRPLQPESPGVFWVPLDEALNDVVALHAGSTFVLALRGGGKVAGWGSSSFGEVYPPAGLGDVIAVSAGSRASVVLKRDGSVFAWGDGAKGPEGLTDVVAISAGHDYVLALKSDATVVAWGANWDGVCDVPEGLNDVVAIVAAGSSSLALKGDGTVVRWGRPPDSGSSVMPQNLGKVVAIDSNGSSTVALRSDGTVVGWGVGYSGMDDIPSEVVDVAAISVGSDCSLALKTDGTVVKWGRNHQGIVLPQDLTNVVAISAGSAISTALQASPAITTPPAGQSVRTGEAATFSVSLFGAGPFTYQWNKDGVPIAGATSPTIVVPSATEANAGTYDVVVSNTLGSTRSRPVRLAVDLTAPLVIAQPAGRAIGIGMGAAFKVETGGSGPLTYQWLKNGIDLNDGGRVSGARTATLSIAEAAVTDAGGYSVLVANDGGAVVSNPALLTVIEAQAAHGVMSGGYGTGSVVTIANSISYAGTLTQLRWSVLPPEGWTYVSGSVAGEELPFPGASGLLEWTWKTVPPSPVTFSFTMQVPAGTSGPKTLTALVLARQAGKDHEVLVRPDPLTLVELDYHAADLDRDFKLSLAELLRMVELYNTRHGTVRTGAYTIDLTNGVDGFRSDPARANAAVVTLPKYHSADFDCDGRFTLEELLRVIELYNYRSGTVRTGAYHLLAGTEDGFSVGP